MTLQVCIDIGIIMMLNNVGSFLSRTIAWSGKQLPVVNAC